MASTPLPLTAPALKTPRAAAIAGILSAVLYGASLIVLRLSVPAFATISVRTGVMSCGWAIVAYALATVLLLSTGYTLWVTLIFPARVLPVSVHFLMTEKRSWV